VHPTPGDDRRTAGLSAREAPRNLEQCLIQELQDLYQAESEQTRVMGELERAATAEELKSAFQDHLAETQQHVERLGQILEMLGESAGGSGSVPAAVIGLIQESHEKLAEPVTSRLRDLMIIAEAQKMEHNEIACYGTARAMAHTLGRDQEAHLLQSTLNEEEQADKRLTQISLKLLKQADIDQPMACEYNPDQD
jgi:ferritin-like metal-binding protein YciE